jgi:hypothetical protein
MATSASRRTRRHGSTVKTMWMTERVTGTGTKSERVRKKRVEGIRKLSPFRDYEERVDSDPAALSIYSLWFKMQVILIFLIHNFYYVFR